MRRPEAGLEDRRSLLRRIGAVALLAMFGWRGAAAADRPTNAFRQETVSDILRALYGAAEVPTSERIRIGVAALAEDGAVVPLKVEVDLPDVAEITLIATRNPVPLVARFEFAPRTRAFVATRIKLAESSEVLAVARTPAGLWSARKHVDVTIGGCG